MIGGKKESARGGGKGKGREEKPKENKIKVFAFIFSFFFSIPKAFPLCCFLLSKRVTRRRKGPCRKPRRDPGKGALSAVQGRGDGRRERTEEKRKNGEGPELSPRARRLPLSFFSLSTGNTQLYSRTRLSQPNNSNAVPARRRPQPNVLRGKSLHEEREGGE